MSDDLNMDVWMKALRDAMTQTRTNGGYTVRELSESTGITDRKVRVLIAKLSEQGVIRVTRTPFTTIDGRMTTVPAYIIVDKKGA